VQARTEAATGSPADVAARQSPGRIARTAYLGAIIAAGALVLAAALVEVLGDPPGATWVVLLAMTCVSAWALVKM